MSRGGGISKADGVYEHLQREGIPCCETEGEKHQCAQSKEQKWVEVNGGGSGVVCVWWERSQKWSKLGYIP